MIFLVFVCFQIEEIIKRKVDYIRKEGKSCWSKFFKQVREDRISCVRGGIGFLWEYLDNRQEG